jgi:hypothetical protein
MVAVAVQKVAGRTRQQKAYPKRNEELGSIEKGALHEVAVRPLLLQRIFDRRQGLVVREAPAQIRIDVRWEDILKIVDRVLNVLHRKKKELQSPHYCVNADDSSRHEIAPSVINLGR